MDQSILYTSIYMRKYKNRNIIQFELQNYVCVTQTTDQIIVLFLYIEIYRNIVGHRTAHLLHMRISRSISNVVVAVINININIDINININITFITP